MPNKCRNCHHYNHGNEKPGPYVPMRTSYLKYDQNKTRIPMEVTSTHVNALIESFKVNVVYH